MTVWEQVVGQESSIGPLLAAAADPASMTHAWLITGPPGSGRSHAARAFAAALLCDDGGCGVCHSCVTVLGGSHADVTLVATEKVTIGIGEVRDLVAVAQRAPSGGKWRIIIVEDADRMTERTSNVLLKAIEEPPPRTVWLLCTPHAHDVPVTIRSRCRVVSLRTPDPATVAELLVRRDGVDPDVAMDAALAAQSHIGIARRLASDPAARARRAQVLALATEVRGVGDAVLAAADLVAVAEEEAASASAQRDAAERAELLAALGADAGTIPPSMRAQVRELEEEQKRRATRMKRDVLDRALTDLMSFYRDVAAVQLGAGDELINRGHREHVLAVARRSDVAQTVASIDAIGAARDRLASNVQPLLAIEALLVALRNRG